MENNPAPITNPQNIKSPLKDITFLFLVTLTIITILSLVTYSPTNSSNLIGSFGFYLAKILNDLFGYSSWIIPVVFFLLAIFRPTKTDDSPYTGFTYKVLGLTFLILSSCGIVHIFSHKGGATGKLITFILLPLFGKVGSCIILTFILLSGLSLLTQFSLINIASFNYLKRFLKYLKKSFPKKSTIKIKSNLNSMAQIDTFSEIQPKIIEFKKEPKIKDSRGEKDIQIHMKNIDSEIALPDISLLTDPPLRSFELDKDFYLKNAKTLEKKLLDFGVAGNVVEIWPGPVVTMYEFSPAPGVKINKISSLSDDIALALGALSVRIIAPIPGKTVVGIEISNEKREIVYLKEILQSDAFTNFKGFLPLALGKDIVGQPVVVDLAKMPHLLIAGATGTGKSVGLNAMICSLLFKLPPSHLRFLMIDPKRIELSPYDNIPHLIHPVISDAKIATKALLWVVNEMEDRYQKLDSLGARNLESYNSLSDDHIPYLVVVIDELADLMMVSSKDVETSIMRLAQKARAAGIHLIVATQRPSVDVITGLIKANFPARISFKVSSKVDSRTILDAMGAERLLGMGDMLYLAPGTSNLMRVHGAFVSDKEVSLIANHLKNQSQPTYNQSIHEFTQNPSEDIIESDGDEAIDEKYDEAVEIVLSTQQTSISFLQRKLKIGYNRAARIIEQMEKEGILSPPDHMGKRKILVS